MTRLDERREKILRYVGSQNCFPLILKTGFYGSVGGGEIVPLLPMAVEDLVMSILDNAESLGSFNQSINRFETSPGRARSSLDIWRHALSVCPELDIFTIMETIYNLRGSLRVNYCSFVHRSVFRRGHSEWDPPNFLTREYGIRFSTWKRLHE